MRRLETRLIGIDQGEIVLFSDYEKNGPMWAGAGERERRHSIRFEERFRDPPVVQCALSMWDIDSGSNARMDVRAETISETGFEVVFRTWSDTRVARARVRWMAIGELHHPDDWELY
ncbi:hypothetical protein D6850_11730 [Roseovarius spongiae]|uniref:H-type lectin domain-containing protein n=1 Tax=Roseovarius spongiae TaxID=2320272 RepID=A0A3A8ATD0_9RHOB|nr:H-type lectin domain-containing protein [Roseovarius spongiae]RKF13860.1 hypothetical protein D6850_11730 [Roseovarius spongiae]